MNRNRISMLEKFMLEEPADPFPVYALALEYQVTEKNKAQELFERLLRDHPDYLPTYYLAGIFFLEQNEINRAYIQECNTVGKKYWKDLDLYILRLNIVY